MRALALFCFLAIAACGGSDDALGDGSLDCGPPIWDLLADVGEGGGTPTPFDAMRGFAIDNYGDVQLHVDTARTATVVVERSEVVFITVDELADETFAVIAVQGCEGFEPDAVGG